MSDTDTLTRAPTDDELRSFVPRSAKDNWIYTDRYWQCPCCFRYKSDIMKWRGGEWRAAIHEHHDHGGDLAIRKADGSYERHENGRLKRTERRFDPILICADCNAIEGRLKGEYVLRKDFSLSPDEIRHLIECGLIVVRPNEDHGVSAEHLATGWAFIRTLGAKR